jgi:hypothetical protein
MHGIDEAESLLHAALADKLFDRVRDVEVITPV